MNPIPADLNIQAVVHKDHQTSYAVSFTMQRGDVLTTGKRDPDNPGWVWCTHSSGISGWVPEKFLDLYEETGTARRNYSTRELDVKTGDKLTLHELESGWYWVSDAQGEKGWVPAACFEL